MNTIFALVKRNTKLFFRDKGLFFTSLVTPAILLFLYTAFLGGVYRDSFAASFPGAWQPSETLLDGLVGGQLVSSILAVSCVTVAFCANFLMVQDKASGSIRDLRITPVRPAALALGYYAAALLSTLLICFAATGLCLAYVAVVGWHLSAADVACLLLDVLLLVLFATALSSILCFFLSTQGQISAVGTIVSAGYGFLCGAYMPISSLGETLQKVLAFLPGTYATGLIRTHALRGVLGEFQAQGAPEAAVDALRDTLDCNLYFLGERVSLPAMYGVLGGAVAVSLVVYILINVVKRKP